MKTRNNRLKKLAFSSLLYVVVLPISTIVGCEKFVQETNMELAEVPSVGQPEATSMSFPNVPGTVVVHSPQSSGIYRGTPSLVKLPNGHIIASNDVFGTGVPNRTDIFKSEDNGATWSSVSSINGAVWSGLFYHNNMLYLLGGNNSGGANLVIRGSTDEGQTWSAPTVIVPGSCHGSSTPVLFANGRIYKAYEFHDTDLNGKWMSGNKAYIVSASQSANLLSSASWTQSERLEKPAWIDGTGWLEANAVLGKDNKIKCITRLASMEGIHAGYYSLSSDINIEPGSAKKIQFWGGASKFNIKYDPVSQKYWSLSNYAPKQFKAGNRSAGGIRNVLALTSSDNLEVWKVNAIILADEDVENVGFQYVDWVFDGNDILFVSRTAYDDGLGGATNYHDANFMTFHRITNFKAATTPSQWLHLLPESGWSGVVKTFDDTNGKGNSSANPILISHPGQLVYLAEKVYQGNAFTGKYFKLTTNINLRRFNFMPIGWYITTTNNRPFSGHFDGGGYRIINLNINRSDNLQTSNALFGYVKDGSVINLGVDGQSTITLGGVCAGIVAYGNNISILNSYSKVQVRGTSQVGGIMGYGVGNNTIRNCYNTGTLVLNTNSGTNKCVGGIAGYFKNGSIQYCYNVGAVSTTYADAAGVGGVIGTVGPTITNAFYREDNVDETIAVGTALSVTALRSSNTLNLLNNGGSAWVAGTQPGGFPKLTWQP